jgi:integrase
MHLTVQAMSHPTTLERSISMPTVQLTSQFVATAACPSDKRKVDYYDTLVTGFILEVRATGSATYYLRYRDPHDRQCQFKIGDTKSVPFERARQAALQARTRVVLGESPQEQKKLKKSVPTFKEMAQEHYLPFVKTYKKSWDCDDSLLRNHLLPTLGAKRLDEISERSISDLHQDMRARGYAKGTCNRVLVLVKYMFKLAKKWKLPGAQDNPTESIKLVDPQNARERYLSVQETQRLRQAIEDSPNVQLKHIVALLLLTGARKRELLDAKWEDFDVERRNWRIPMSKSGKARHVPLSGAVLDILKTLPRWEGCPYVVPNPQTQRPFKSVFYSWNTARKEAGLEDVRMHDLRHSFASFLVNAGRSLYEVQELLGHADIKTTSRYAHLAEAVEVVPR